jgi:hypothetical protein
LEKLDSQADCAFAHRAHLCGHLAKLKEGFFPFFLVFNQTPTQLFIVIFIKKILNLLTQF